MGNRQNRRIRQNVVEPPQNPTPPNIEHPVEPSSRQPRSRRNSRKSAASGEEEKKKKKVQCSACAVEIEASHGGLQCRQGHHLCLNECTKTFVNCQLADGLSAVPLKCPMCKIEYNEIIVERVMDVQQMDKYIRLVITKKLMENPDNAETLVTCPNCNYYEYRHAKAEEIMFVYCQDPSCKKISCNVCKKTIESEIMIRLSDVEEARSFDSSDEDNEDENEFDQHMKCNELQYLKLRFEKLLDKGQGGECPKCHLVGTKNSGDCNHMTCPECGNEWCYMCGKDKDALNLDPDDSFYDHYNEESACVMYIHQIYEESDRSDSESEEENEMEETAETLYYRKKTLTLLKGFRNEIGTDTFAKLAHQFPSVGNSGYTIQDIENFVL